MSHELEGEVISDRGRFKFSDRAFYAYQLVAGVVRPVAENQDYSRLPEYKSEKIAFANLLADAVTQTGRIDFLLPVCPDYGSGHSFYQRMHGGVSLEAMGAINFAGYMDAVVQSVGLESSYTIMVADTEDDIPEIIDRVADGNIEQYKASCHASVESIRNQVGHINSVQVTTFSELLGDDFRTCQYGYEEGLRSLSENNSKFRSSVERVGCQRVGRHSQILGREEQNFELTYRYMAQYASLGTVMKYRGSETLAIVNYPTPNRKFLNATQNVDRSISMLESDNRVIPVLGSIVNR